MPDNKPFIDPAAILKKIPMLFRGPVKDAVSSKQGVKIIGVINKLAPLGEKVNAAIDFNLLAEWISEQKFVKDKPLMKSAILAAAGEIEKLDDK